MLEPAEQGPVVVVSPHLDDGVFGCGQLLAARPGATVVTVCAGVPDPGEDGPTEWDQACGFRSSAQALEARREEDRRALALLGAGPRWLSFRDDQYGRPAAVPEIAAALRALLKELQPAAVCIPMGLFHRDHHCAHEAARLLMSEALAPRWFAYEEPMYRRVPGLVQARLAELLLQRITATPVVGETAHGPQKRRAVLAYASQLRGLASAGRPGHVDTFAAERHWRLEPAASA